MRVVTHKATQNKYALKVGWVAFIFSWCFSSSVLSSHAMRRDNEKWEGREGGREGDMLIDGGSVRGGFPRSAHQKGED